MLCEDDGNLGSLLCEYLQAKGYVVDLLLDGEQGYKAFRKQSTTFVCWM
jgi:DNA-binding response OmpR family regulator